MGRAFLPWIACLCLGGCGRLGFDASGSGDDAQPGAVTLRYPIDTAYGIRAVTPVSLVPVATGDPTFSTVTPLPAGVSIDATTGEISGIPLGPVDDTYIVRATGALGMATAKITLLYASGYVVDVTRDGADDDDGTGDTCFSTQAGGCSLRAAIQTANGHENELHVITLGAAVYTVDAQMTSIRSHIVIAGAGASATTVHPPVAHPGYGLFALSAPWSLTLAGTRFAEFGMRDGAVVAQSGGHLSVMACAFENNFAAGSGGVFFITGGATAQIQRSSFTKNEAFGGCCGGWGGVVDGEGAMTRITFSQCYATENRSNWGSFAHITTGTTLVLESSTLHGNTATTAGTLASPGGAYSISSSTIVHNANTSSSRESAGLFLYSDPAHYTVQGSIVAYNTDSSGAEYNCNRRVATVTLTSLGGNVLGDDAGNCAAYFTEPGDLLSTDPELAPGPAANGGLTDSLMPNAASPVLDNATACPAVDQRGMPRDPQRCDSGAVERP